MRSIFAVLLLLALPMSARATTADDSAAQTLANVPALAKLATKGDRAIESHLRKIGSIYVRAGYPKTGAALRQSGDALSLFAAPGNDVRPARMALRDLARALARENFYLVPATNGDRLPNYRDLAAVFRDNARTVLKNVTHGRPPTRKIAGRQGTLWLTRTADGTVEPRGSHGSSSSGGLIATGGSGLLLLPKFAIFPPGVELPPEGSYRLIGTFGEPDVIDGIAFPAGSLVVQVATDFDLPEGAADHGGSLSFGFRELTPQSNATLFRSSGTRWIAYPSGTTLPENPLRTTVHLDVSYEANGIQLQPGSAIRERYESYVVPEGAVDLGGPNLELIRLGGAPTGAFLTP